MNARVKINFRIEQDESGYPPFLWEGIWAEKVEDQSYIIDNIPFYAKGISVGDLVCAKTSENGLVYEWTIEKSENSTVRAIVYDEDIKSFLFDVIKKCGCEYEVGVPKTLVAVNVPVDANYASLLEYLNQETLADHLDYEESAPRYPA
jgi:hypothetical protein